MYRKRARAAHVLQQPSVGSSAQAPAQANGPPVGAGAAGLVPGGYDPAAGGVSQGVGGGVQFFNPMTYQNGYVTEPQGQQQAAAQFHPQQGGVQQQQPQFQQAATQNQQQYPGGGQVDVGGGTSVPPAAGGQLDLGGGVPPAEQQQADQYYTGHSQQELQQQANAEQFQNQAWGGNSGHGSWSRQPSQESNHTQSSSQVNNHADLQHREPSQESHYNEHSHHPAADQAWQQANYQAVQSDQQNAGQGSQHQQEQQYELILDPSGQWCWDYHGQNWIPYYAEQHAQPQVAQQEEQQKPVVADERVGNNQINGGWDGVSQSQDGSQVATAQQVDNHQVGEANIPGSDDISSSAHHNFNASTVGQQHVATGQVSEESRNVEQQQQLDKAVMQQSVAVVSNVHIEDNLAAESNVAHEQMLAGDYTVQDRNQIEESQGQTSNQEASSQQGLIQGIEKLDLGAEIPPSFATASSEAAMSQQQPPQISNHPAPDNQWSAQSSANPEQNLHVSGSDLIQGQPPAEISLQGAVHGQNVFNAERSNPLDMGEMSGQSMGPPDLVDMRQYNQPEIVNDTNHHPPAAEAGAHAPPPPDMFASLPISSFGYSGSPGISQPDIEQVTHSSEQGAQSPGLVGQPDLGGQQNVMPIASAAPDLTAQSVIQSHGNEALSMPGNGSAGDPYLAISGPASLPSRSSGGASAHDQHYDFYKDQIESAMPDLTSGQRPSANSSRASLPVRRSSQDKAPDILRTEPLVPSTDRNLYMETGELQEEDVHRVSHDIPGPLPASIPPFTPSQQQVPAAKPPSDLPPMVGGNEPPMVGSSDPPSIVRMVVGETTPPSLPPPLMMPIPPPNQRLVEGESNTMSSLPPLPAREIEGEAGSDARPVMYPNSIDRTIEGEDESSTVAMVPPPVQTREVEGEPQPLPPPPSTARLPPPPGVSMRAPLPSARTYPGGQLPPPGVSSQADQDFGPLSSTQSTPLDSSPIHQLPSPVAPAATTSTSPTTEVRSAAAGSDKRDETVMGGPPAPVKAPPLPTPGRAVAGQESTAQQGQGGYNPPARRRGDEHKKSTYDSDDDNIPESENERNNVQKRRIQPRRNLSPKSNRPPRPVRGYDRLNRSSTDRDDDSDRKHDYYRDDEDYYNGNRSLRNYERRNYGKDRRHHYDDDREDDRRSLHHRDDDRRSLHGREEDRRSMYGRDDDRRSYHGGRRIKQERYRDDRYRDEGQYRRNRMDSDMDRESYYGEDTLNRSRPGSRAGSVSHYDPNESMYRGGMPGGMAFLQQQFLQQQHQYHQMQYQLQSAVHEMEKVLSNPEHVNTYKAYWDTYGKQPHLMDKLRLENPVLHHLLLHFRQNYWHLVEKKPNIKEEPEAAVKNETVDQADMEVEEFARKFHQKSPSHRPESREAGQESTIAAPADTSVEQMSSGQILPERLTPLMFSRPHVCARISASGLLVKVEAHSPRDGQSATVELHSVTSLLHHTQDYRQLATFPGPLKPKETHKNDVIKFCERKIQDSRERRMMDKDSYELIWRMLILLLRQKGQVEGSDLADLLISDKNRMDTSMDALPTDRSRGGSSYRGQLDAEETASMSSFSEDHGERTDRTDRTTSSKTYINSGSTQEEYVSKFRSYLLHGNKQEGLEFAMKVGLWGHALFLASKMDQRTYASVMTRFANGLAVNDPLQTLYQLMSARIPAAMKNFADQRLGDWRPHLAMILSNPYPGSDINRRSMVTLGDTLLSKGQIFAAQFCYIVSALEFGTFTKKTSKLVLLLSMPGEKSVDEFASNESIQCTEIYEFVQKLGNSDYEMPTLQPFKLLHAIRLLEVGLVSQAQDYCKEISEFVIRNPTKIVTDFLPDFLSQLETLSDKLKYQDPQYTTSSGELSEIPDPDWLVKLRETVHNINSGVVYTGSDAGEMDTMSYEPHSGYYDYSQYQQQSADCQAYAQPEDGTAAASVDQTNANAYPEYSSADYNQNQYPNVEESSGEKTVPEDGSHQPGENLQNGWNHMHSIPEQVEGVEHAAEPPMAPYDPSSYQDQTGVEAEQSADTPEDVPTFDPAATAPPPMFMPSSLGYNPGMQPLDPTSIPPPSMPPVDPSSLGPGSRKASLSESEVRRNSLAPPGNTAKGGVSEPLPNFSQAPSSNEKDSQSATKPTDNNSKDKKATKGEPTKKSSWFGGIFGKILRPPNQVHLPDDKNKTIYYDDKLGRWVNTEEDEDTAAPAAPPPMDPAFMNKKSDGSAPLGMPAPTLGTSPTMDLPPAAPTSFRATKRKGRAYVDVIGQSGITKPIAGAGPPMLMPGSVPASPDQPASLPPMLFNPGAAPLPGGGEDGPSSLQLGDVGPGTPEATDAGGEQAPPPGMPMMFNPSSMGSVTAPPTF